MDYSRYCRFNSKKIDYLSSLFNEPFDMAYFFPYSSCKPKNVELRYLLNSFKNMSKKWRFCYALTKDCIALIKQQGYKDFDYVPQIDNNVFVYTNIEDEFDNFNCELVWDREELIALFDIDTGMVNDILKDMESRKIDKKQLELLKEHINHIKFISVLSEFIPINDLKASTFAEFKWRVVLYYTNLYKNNSTHKNNLTLKRSRVEDSHSILKDFDTDSINSIEIFFSKLEKALSNNSKVLTTKLVYEFIINEFGTHFLENNAFEEMLELYYRQKITKLENIERAYSFLELSPYSTTYKSFFQKRKRIYGKDKTQRIMRKLKSEYFMLNQIMDYYIDMKEEHLALISRAIAIYKDDLGDNKLPNQGFGYTDDGWEDNLDSDGDYDPDDAYNDIRSEAAWEAEQERLWIEEQEREMYEEYDDEIPFK